MRLLATTLFLGPSLAVADPFYWDIPPDQDVIILGEVHDNPHHHRNQAEALAALQPAAVVFEMLDPTDAQTLFRRSDRENKDIAAELAWETSGWPNYELYEPVFAALGEAWVYGAEVERSVAIQAFDSSVVEVFQTRFVATYGPDAAFYGLDQPLQEDQQALREQGQLAAHCGMLPPDMLPDFVAVQRLRDTALAWAVLQALEETYGPVIVITGNGHARTDWGLPAILRTADPSLEVFSVGQIEGGQTDMPFDMIVETEAVDRPDPCAAFEN